MRILRSPPSETLNLDYRGPSLIQKLDRVSQLLISTQVLKVALSKVSGRVFSFTCGSNILPLLIIICCCFYISSNLPLLPVPTTPPPNPKPKPPPPPFSASSVATVSLNALLFPHRNCGAFLSGPPVLPAVLREYAHPFLNLRRLPPSQPFFCVRLGVPLLHHCDY